ncbi:MAG: hypothetical protein LAT84_11140 [Balneolia bacterium]|nr:hypothetical protein [Balneolia bacterium]
MNYIPNILLIIVTLCSLLDSPSLNLPSAPKLDFNRIIQDGELSYFGVPIALQLVQYVTISDKQFLSLPILMDEPEIPEGFRSKLIDPSKWDERHNTGIDFGRRSIWYMNENQTILYSVLLDIRSESDIGIGLVIIHYHGNNTYDILLNTLDDITLFAASAKFHRIDTEAGFGTFIALPDQKNIKNKYQPKWNIEPSKFFLIGF